MPRAGQGQPEGAWLRACDQQPARLRDLPPYRSGLRPLPDGTVRRAAPRPRRGPTRQLGPHPGWAPLNNAVRPAKPLQYELAGLGASAHEQVWAATVQQALNGDSAARSGSRWRWTRPRVTPGRYTRALQRASPGNRIWRRHARREPRGRRPWTKGGVAESVAASAWRRRTSPSPLRPPGPRSAR